MNIYKEKYEKYKKKYLDLKKLLGGLPPKVATPSKAGTPPKAASGSKAASPPKEEPSTKPPNPRAINIECYNKKFKLEYDNRTLSIISILNECLIDSDKWDGIIKHIFHERKSKFTFLRDLDVIDLLNFRFKTIKDNLNKDRPYTIEKLIAEINKIDEELIHFLRTNPDQDRVCDLLLLLSYENIKSLDSLSLVDAFEKVKEELIPMTEERTEEFMHKQIQEQKRVPIPNVPLESSLVFSLPEDIFPAAMKERYNFMPSRINDRTKTASRLQLELFSLTDKQVYIIIRDLIFKFNKKIDLDLLQYNETRSGRSELQGRGEDYNHFDRPLNNLTKIIKTDKELEGLKTKISYPICIEIFQVGRIFEFLERIKFLVQKKEKLKHVARSLTPDAYERSTKNHIRKIIDLYIYINSNKLWNLVIELYNIQKILFNEQTSIYDDMSLIISFISYYLNTNEHKAPQIDALIDILYRGIQYR